MTWTTYASTPNPTGQGLDVNLLALARMGIYPCTTGGNANAITLAYTDTSAPSLAAYQNYQEFVFIAGSTNNSAVTIAVGALAVLNAYKDTPAGPVVFASGEIVQNCAYVAVYDSALNASAGGFHVRSGAFVANSPVNASQVQVASGATLSRMLSGQFTVAFTVVPANTQQEQVVALAGALAGDLVMLGPPATVSSGILLNARVPASGSVTIRAGNFTAASVAAFTLSPLHVGVLGMTP